MNTNLPQDSGKIPVCSEKESLYSYCIKHNKQYILDQWDYVRNTDTDPKNVTAGSHQMVWWRCEKGHRWQAQIKSRVRKAGCPVCTNRIVEAGENDLATTHPALAAQWHEMKNAPLTPYKVTAGSHKKVWWRCPKGHEWQSAVYSRGNGAGCPVCAGKVVIAGENDLASAYPQIAAQWHPTRNGELKPSEVTPFSNRNVWWICGMGHEYSSTVAHRTQEKSECPYCTGRKVLVGFNDLATKEPKLSEQWDEERNGSLTPQMVTAASHKKVWWKCSDGHVWQARIASRTGARRHGCPVCAGKVRDGSQYDSIMAEYTAVKKQSDT
ncbi:MAG: zinc-ribbon domain-containing protein [Clostridia bacterium]|nr:zinc-ribbon domain-containing protein [Clostridia bacterium]